MKVYESTEVRNVALVGHGNSGKTTLAAGMLFASGVTNRLTRVDEGNTTTDYDDEEISRKITISTALAAAEWKKMKLNLLDTPGFNLFMYDNEDGDGRCRCGSRDDRRHSRRRGPDGARLAVRRRVQSAASFLRQQVGPRT